MIPSREDVQGFMLICRRLADACWQAETCFLRGFTDPWIDRASGLVYVLDEPMDPAYRIQFDNLQTAIESLYGEALKTMKHPDFAAPYGWSKLGYHIARLRDPEQGLFRYDPEKFFIKHPIDGRLAYHTSLARDRFKSLGERMTDLIRWCELELSFPDDPDDGPTPHEPPVAASIGRSEASPGRPATDGAPIDFEDLAARMRKAKKRNSAMLVEYMADRTQATTGEVADRVHGDGNASLDAIRKNVERTNDFLAEIGSRLSFRFVSERVFREISPE